MNRYGFLGFAGALIIAVVLVNGAGLWMAPLAIPVLLGVALGWNWLIIAGAVVYVAYRFWAGAPGWYDVAFFVGWGMNVIGSNALCPRCGLPVGISDGMWRHSPVPHYCIGCGRYRRDVWPFQYALKPEAWDGEYHDEGGGPAPDSYHAEVARYHAQQQWLKKRR